MYHFEIGKVISQEEGTKSIFTSESLLEAIDEWVNEKYTRPEYFMDIWEEDIPIAEIDHAMPEEDIWIYPEDFTVDKYKDMIINVFQEEDYPVELNKYKLPDNWKNIVTQDKGKDGKASIHDIMIAI